MARRFAVLLALGLFLFGVGMAQAQETGKTLWRSTSSLSAGVIAQGSVSVAGLDRPEDGVLDRLRIQSTLDLNGDNARDVFVRVRTLVADQGLDTMIEVRRFAKDSDAVEERIEIDIRHVTDGSERWQPDDERRATVIQSPNDEASVSIEMTRTMLQPFSDSLSNALTTLGEEYWQLASKHFDRSAFTTSAILWTLSGYLHLGNGNASRGLLALGSAATDFSLGGPFQASREVKAIMDTLRLLRGGGGGGGDPVQLDPQ